MKCPHEHCTRMAVAFIDAEIARGNINYGGTKAVAAHLTERTGIPHSLGMAARILDDEGKRDSAARARERVD